jgi:hypothetical protein
VEAPLMAGIALLLGLFVVPLALLAAGHRLRERSARVRGAFWGGVIGHSTAVVIAVTAMHYPPVLWTGEVRTALALWSMLLGGVLGMILGGVRGARRG